MNVTRTDTAAARLIALKERLRREAAAAVRAEADAILAAAAARLPRDAAPRLEIEAGTDPLALKIIAAGAAARALELGTREAPAQPFLFSALAERLRAFKAALAARLKAALPGTGAQS